MGRSNVGKSSLINALVRRRIARASAAPGKTRLANVYQVTAGGGEPFYLVDLPGYGYARGGGAAARGFDELTAEFFGRVRQVGPVRQVGGVNSPARPPPPAPLAHVSALLIVDSRHPGLRSDIRAWQWLQSSVERVAIVATKIDKLARGERIRALRQHESVFDRPVQPVSAVSGEGLEDLWKLIAQRLTSG